jgi:hypothetical protein
MTIEDQIAEDAEILPYHASPIEITTVREIRLLIKYVIDSNENVKRGYSQLAGARNAALKSTNKPN